MPLFLQMARAAAVGSSHASNCRSGARKTFSGEPNCVSSRADRAAAMPFVKHYASQGRAVSSCTERNPAVYVPGNLSFDYLLLNMAPEARRLEWTCRFDRLLIASSLGPWRAVR